MIDRPRSGDYRGPPVRRAQVPESALWTGNQIRLECDVSSEDNPAMFHHQLPRAAADLWPGDSCSIGDPGRGSSRLRKHAALILETRILMLPSSRRVPRHPGYIEMKR